jgi:hypothetical protein
MRQLLILTGTLPLILAPTVPANAAIHEMVAAFCSGGGVGVIAADGFLEPPGVENPDLNSFRRPATASGVVALVGLEVARLLNTRRAPLSRPSMLLDPLCRTIPALSTVKTHLREECLATTVLLRPRVASSRRNKGANGIRAVLREQCRFAPDSLQPNGRSLEP